MKLSTKWILWNIFYCVIMTITCIWTFFNVGPIFAVVVALIPSRQYIETKLDELESKRNKLLHMVDDSGEYKSGEYKKQRREFKRKWRLR